jgi:hypothetical protein
VVTNPDGSVVTTAVAADGTITITFSAGGIVAGGGAGKKGILAPGLPVCRDGSSCICGDGAMASNTMSCTDGECTDGSLCTARTTSGVCANAGACTGGACTDGTICFSGSSGAAITGQGLTCVGPGTPIDSELTAFCSDGMCPSGVLCSCMDGTECVNDACSDGTACKSDPATQCADGSVCANDHCADGIACGAVKIGKCDDGSTCNVDR